MTMRDNQNATEQPSHPYTAGMTRNEVIKPLTLVPHHALLTSFFILIFKAAFYLFTVLLNYFSFNCVPRLGPYDFF